MSTSVINRKMTLRGLEKTITEEAENNQNKRGNFLLRQELKDYTPGWDLKFAMGFLGLLIVVFGASGVVILLDTKKFKSYHVNYTNCTLKYCLVSFEIKENFEDKIFMYYNLDNFYNNHRLYARSKSYQQLVGKDNPSTTFCNDALLNNETLFNDSSKYTSILGNSLNGSDIAFPCGLVAQSFFNGKFVY
jgi:hypothetical protein